MGCRFIASCSSRFMGWTSKVQPSPPFPTSPSMPADIMADPEEHLADVDNMLVDGAAVEPAASPNGEETKENVTVVAPSPSPVKLEAIISDIQGVIDQLQPIAGASQAAGWHASLKTVREEAARRPDVLIAFVGATGAGKSSLINALLGDHIVPTSGVKSCTSTPIIISYHDSEQVSAKIEFVSTASWQEELRLFLEALVEAGGVLARLADDAKEAWHRVRVVYPKLTAQTLLRMTAEQVLANSTSIAGKLGTTFAFSSAPAFFNQELQDHTRARSLRDDAGDLWPLIAQISICCKAPVLEPGIALVDLPGVLDSNAARAAIAGEYMKRCDNVFVVAPIKRAATDQVARDLMGDAFKTQLMNGKYSADCVALIATCNDDILCSEAVLEFTLGAVPGWARLQNELGSVETQMNVNCAELELLRHQMPQFASSEAFDDPPTSYEDPSKTLKRSMDAIVIGQSPTKKQKMDNTTIAASTIDPTFPCLPNESSADATLSKDSPTITTPASIASAIAAKEAENFALTCARNDLNQQCTKFCAGFRSEWARNELQEQFQEGRIALYGPTDFSDSTPEDEDYINVFPVSARDCLKLLGKSPLDGRTSLVFQTVEETGIPAVIEFCRKIGQKGSRKAKHRLGMKLSSIVTQLETYVSKKSCGAGGGDSNAEDTSNDTAPQCLQTMSHRIATSLREVADSTSTQVMQDLESILFPQMVAAPGQAVAEVRTHITRVGKALKHWRTLKAVLRRNGSWKEYEWNGQAIGLISVHFATTWARVLALHCLKSNTSVIISSIKTVISMLDASSPPDMQAKIAKYKARVFARAESCSRRASDKCRTMIRSSQAEISRAMNAKFADQMRPSYQSAYALTGTGVMMQAMGLIRQALDEKGLDILTSIINESVDALRSAVQEALREYYESLRKLSESVESLLLPIIILQNRISDSPLQEDMAIVLAKLEAIANSIKSYEDDSEQQL